MLANDKAAKRITGHFQRWAQAAAHTLSHAVKCNAEGPFKEYSKTDPVDLPPVKAQVLRGGKLVNAPDRE